MLDSKPTFKTEEKKPLVKSEEKKPLAVVSGNSSQALRSTDIVDLDSDEEPVVRTRQRNRPRLPVVDPPTRRLRSHTAREAPRREFTDSDSEDALDSRDRRGQQSSGVVDSSITRIALQGGGMEASHLCNFNKCLNPAHIAMEGHDMNLSRGFCFNNPLSVVDEDCP